MVKNAKNMFVNMFFRLIASLMVFICLAVILYPAATVGAAAQWDGMNHVGKPVIIDLTDEILPVGSTYVYDKRCVKGAIGSDALFRENNLENIKINFAFSNPDAANKDYGEVEIVDNYLCYTPGRDAEDTMIQLLLKLQISTTRIVDAYQLNFQVGMAEADAESGGLASLGYQLDGGQTVPIPNYAAEVQEYQITLPSDTPVGTEVTLTGTPLDPKASVRVEPSTVALSYETQPQILTVQTPDGATRKYTVYFVIAQPEIQPSVTINGTKYESGDTLLLDYQQPVKINIDTGSGEVEADDFAVWIETATQPGCLPSIEDENGMYSEIESQVTGRGASKMTIRFYYENRSQSSYKDIQFMVSTRADYSSLKTVLEDVPADLSLYTEKTVQKLQQLMESINYNLDFSAQSDVSKLASDIRKAISALEYRPADYTRIDQLTAKLDILPDIYTQESMDTVRQIVESIQPGLNICSQSIIDSCAEKLQKAIDDLTIRSEEYAELHNLFFQIPEDLSIYSEITVNRLNQVIQTVKKQISSAESNELNQLAVMMRQAIDGLRLIGSVDFSALEAFIETLPDSFDWYTDQTVQQVLKWKEHALALMQDENVLQEQVDECLEQLKIAVEGLTLRKADYSVIENALDQLPDDLSGYTAASVEVVTRLIASINWDMDITHQEQLNLLAEQLLEMISKLVPKPEIIPQPNPDEKPSVIIPEDIPDSSSKKTGWRKENGKVVFYKNGKKVTGWQEIEEARYYFTEDGYLVSGWLQLDNKWYYLNKEGIQQIGWIKLGNAWYYLMPKTGVMAADGLKMIENEIYGFYDWGGMMNTTWYQIGEQWYFFNGGGHMVKEQWVQWKGKWYYLASDGKMAVDTITPDGYRVDKDGVWIP